MSLDLTRIRALCFDVDGTLRDTDDQLVQNLVKALKPFRFLFSRRNPHPFARRAIMSIDEPGNFLIHLTDRINIDGTLARLGDRFYSSSSHQRASPPQIIPGIQGMLSTLSGRYPMAIVSARGQLTTQSFLDYHQLTPFFEIVVAGQTCKHTKPYPDPILWAAERMRVPPESCLMIGDTTVDIRAGRTAGAQTVGVLCGFGQEDELVRAGADLIMPTTSMLPDYL